MALAFAMSVDEFRAVLREAITDGLRQRGILPPSPSPAVTRPAPRAKKHRKSISYAVRAAVIERDGLVCGICRLDVAPQDVHIDHVRPVSRGGSNAMANLRVTHGVCNMKRGNRVDS